MKLTLRIFSREGSDLFRHIHPAAQLFIGRGPDCEVCLTNTSVSWRHAQLGYEPDGWWICDQDSTNRTSLDGVELSPWHRVMLPERGTLTFGESSVQFWVEGEGARPPIASTTPPVAPPERNPSERLVAEAQLLSAQLAEVREGIQRCLLYTAEYRTILTQLLDELAAQPRLQRANDLTQEASRQVFDLVALLESLSAHRSAAPEAEGPWSR